LDTSLDNIVVVDSLPQVPDSKYDKLLSATLKVESPYYCVPNHARLPRSLEHPLIYRLLRMKRASLSGMAHVAVIVVSLGQVRLCGILYQAGGPERC
jgi:hypothetical protein